MKHFLLSMCILLISSLQAQTFTEVTTAISPLFFASADFADYDNDGDQDLAIIGVDDNFNDMAEIYRNDGGSFTAINAGLTPIHMGAVSWADFDGDGDFDLLCAGQDYSMNASAIVYLNENGSFVPAGLELPAGFWNSAGWGDYDNDGDLDLAYSWYTTGTSHSSIFKNGNGTLTDIGAGITGLTEGSMEWGDYDGDGDLDLLHTGTPADFSNTLVLIYENNEGNFTDIGVDFMDCTWYNNALWSDVDNDGDLDVLYIGDNGMTYPFVVYINNNGTFEMVNTGLTGVRTSNGNIGLVAGDIDNDGDLDVVNTGDSKTYDKSTKIFINNNGTFTELAHTIPGFGSGTLDLTDIDNDGDLDLFFAGYDSNSDADVALFINDANSNTYSTNLAPDAPANLTSVVGENSVELSWDAAMDDHTPELSLQYNIYIGTASAQGNVVCAQSVVDPQASNNGFHFVPKNGNCQNMLTFHMDNLPDGLYYWSVQAIDQSGSASAFAAEQFFDIGNVTGTQAMSDVSGINLYPNPTNHTVHVSCKNGLAREVNIFSLTGQLMKTLQATSADFDLDVNDLSSGMYVIELITNDTKAVKKLRIER